MRVDDLKDSVALIFDIISEALEDGRRVEIRGFGAFTIRHRDARVGRNPRTGEIVEVESGCVPFFKMGKGLRTMLNSGAGKKSG